MENKIPKTIHYCWFGKNEKGETNPKSELIEKCMRSWKLHLPDYKIVEWNEENFDVNSHPYTKEAYHDKKWAFVSDYVRLQALYQHGGIYLDTDMYVLKSLDDLLRFDLVLGRESQQYISAGMIAAAPNNNYIADLIKEYDNIKTRETVPIIMTKVFGDNSQKYFHNNIKIFDPIYFYPFTSNNIKRFDYNNAPSESYEIGRAHV